MVSDEDLEAIASELERIRESTDRLRELGAETDLPTVERNAIRLQGTLRMLEAQVPPEVHEE